MVAMSSPQYTMSLPVFSTGNTMEIDVLEDIVKIETPYQEIHIVDTREFGKALVIDGLMQAAESDHGLYDVELLKLLRKNHCNLLILGGGDGFIGIQALKLFPNMQITIVDIDEQVTNCCNQYLHTTKEDKRLLEHIRFIHTDAIQFLKTEEQRYDAIVCDLTDAPVGTKEIENFTDFYRDTLNAAQSKLNNMGWMSFQSGSKETHDIHIPARTILRELVSKYFNAVEESCVFIPSYGEEWSFLSAQNK